MFYEAVLIYAKSKDLNIEYGVCDLPKEKSKRPTISEVLSFLESALVNDVPVAFLNLCNGDEKNLDRWHWVTIVSLDYSSDGKSAFIVILDEGMIKKINFAL